MRLGLFMMPVHPPSRAMHETLAEDLEKSLLADRLGFDSEQSQGGYDWLFGIGDQAGKGHHDRNFKRPGVKM
jgi:hypothetical protein